MDNMYKVIDPKGYGISKAKLGLIQGYQPLFAPLVGQAISLLELGVFHGATLRFWSDYFENATIVGLDCNPPIKIDDSNSRIHIYQGYQQDTQLLDRIVKEQAPDGFNVVIDDCSHIGRFARISFWHLFQNHLKPGGLYAIEDWGTGYVRSWPDGRPYKPKSQIKYTRYERMLDRFRDISSHDFSRPFPHFPRLSAIHSRLFTRSTIPSHTYGMVGFAKELLDACYLGYRAIPRSGSGRYFDYGISQIYINSGVIIISKSKDKDAFNIDTILTKDSSFTSQVLRDITEEDDHKH
jgi:hypothetical protein